MALGRQLVLALLGCLLGAAGLSAQNTGTVTGRVLEGSTQEPLAGVTVAVAERSGVTGADGRFTLGGVPAGTHTLRATRIGFGTVTQQVTVAAGQTATVELAMSSQALMLEEVVAIGYGTRSSRDVAGAVEGVTAEEFNTGRIVSPEQLIQGKVAGVQVVTSGEPGGGTNLRIRGGSSADVAGGASNEPLIVVDGVPLPVGGGLSAGRNPLNFINPEDIASVTVLKDAASTAIYGSRGANGVILIETKNGAAAGPSVTYSSSFSTSSPIGEASMLSAEQLRAAVAQYEPAQVSRLGSANTDWRSAVLDDAMGQEHQVALNGSGTNMNYRLSLNYLDQEGVLRGSEMERVTAALSYNHRLFNDRLGIRATLRGARTDDRFTPGSVLGTAMAFDPTQPIYTDDGQYFEFATNRDAPNNPIAELDLVTEQGTTYRAITNLEARYELPFLDGLSATLRTGYDVGASERRGFWPSTLRAQIENPAPCVRAEGAPECRTGTVNRSNPRETTGIIDAFGNYTGRISSLNSDIDATAGYSYEQRNGDYPFLQGRGLVVNALGTSGLADAQVITSTLGVRESRLASFFGRVNVTMADRYLLTLSVRRDGSSRFGPDNQWGTFPAVALGWRVSDEPFMQGLGWLDELKLRGSWGVNGNQEFGDYRWVPSYSISDAFARAQFGGEFVTTIRPTAVDPDIKWEETTSWNVGFDYAVLDGRLSGAVDYYVKDTDDLLFEVIVPAGSYVSNRIVTNVGSIRNRGLEFSLNAAVLRGNSLGGLTWDANFNAATNTNRLLKIDALNLSGARIFTGSILGAVGNNIQVLQPDSPIRSFLVFRHKRDASGNPIVSTDKLDMYEDINDDDQINELDRVPFHSPAPQWTFGHSSTFGYRNLDLGFTLRAQLGSYVYNNLASFRGNYAELLTNAGITNLHSSVLENGFTEPEYFSDIYVEDASFLRMDNLTLGYTVPRFRGLEGVRLFGTVQNVFTITDYTGVDPEAGIGGIDNTIYPRSRTFTAGVSVGF
ncbi:MAG TPA: SusC/RagA family TonB-linked outer membrane protein [Longimicrobium sp.]|nr:SusC/RagA family TonB-linked outer membrane protein [Longimicrobium sp.]